jgi:hypothetical protein
MAYPNVGTVCRSLPSGRISSIFPSRVNPIQRPSGDHAGPLRCKPDVVRAVVVPPAAMSLIDAAVGDVNGGESER